MRIFRVIMKNGLEGDIRADRFEFIIDGIPRIWLYRSEEKIGVFIAENITGIYEVNE